MGCPAAAAAVVAALKQGIGVSETRENWRTLSCVVGQLAFSNLLCVLQPAALAVL